MSTQPAGGDSTVPRCQRCGNDVSHQYALVFGDNDDILHGCPECKTGREMYEGGGTE